MHNAKWNRRDFFYKISDFKLFLIDFFFRIHLYNITAIYYDATFQLLFCVAEEVIMNERIMEIAKFSLQSIEKKGLRWKKLILRVVDLGE